MVEYVRCSRFMRGVRLLVCAAIAALAWQVAADAGAPAPETITIRRAVQAHVEGRTKEAGGLCSPLHPSETWPAIALHIAPYTPLTLDAAEAQYKVLLQRHGHVDNAAASLLGILYCQTQRPDEAAPLLENAPARDWVAHEFMGGVYMLLARRLLSSKAPDRDRQHLKALKLSAREFNLSLAHHSPQPQPAYPQAVFAKERPVVYRAYGDALAWSGDAAAAVAVFERGVLEGYWPHGAQCRPAKARPVLGIPLHTLPARTQFPHVAVKLESALEMMQREFEAVDAADVEGCDVWTRESAGLHSHGSSGSWHVLVLVVNGQPQHKGCSRMPDTCALLMSLPSVRHLRDGQAKLSRMTPGTRVLPHAGPTNLRLRLQLPIRVHEHGNSRIRVASHGWRTWSVNQSFVFDESCEHEVEVGGALARTVLLVDFANPLLVSKQDYVSVALRLARGDGLDDQVLQAHALEAASEWEQAQAHWQRNRAHSGEL